MASEPVDAEEYASSEDSDFAPDEAGDQAASDASDDDGDYADGHEDGRDATRRPAKRKRAPGDGEAEDAGFENSGDEAIIEKGKKKRRKKGKDKDAVAATAEQVEGEGDDDEDGVIRIKTRSQRAVEKAEKKTKLASGPVTVDVDALWAEMTSGPNGTSSNTKAPAEEVADQPAGTESSPLRSREQQQPAAGTDLPDTIRIKRTYTFAGKVHTEEKVVARDSAEAKLYLASLESNGDEVAVAQAAGAGDDDATTSPKRIPRKAFRSAFEPHVDQQLLARGDLNLAVSVRLRAREELLARDAKKLNTVEKSRMDWAGYVDKEGIKDELVLAGKAKDSFAGRQDFLARSEARREDEARRVRLAGKV